MTDRSPLEFLHDAARDVGVIHEPEEVARRVLAHVKSALGAESVLLLDDENAATAMVAHCSTDRQLPMLRDVAFDRTCIVHERRPLRIGDLGTTDHGALEAYDPFMFGVGSVEGGAQCLLGVERSTPLHFDELQLLCGLASVAATAIEQGRMRVRAVAEHAKLARLARYFSPAVADRLAERVEDVFAKPQRRDATVMFCDVRGFTAVAEGRDPAEVLEILNTWYRKAIPVVFEHGGMIDKLLGDGLMAIFGIPELLEDHAEKAASCALALQEACAALNVSEFGLSELRVGVGLHSGPVVVGDVGAAQYRDFTVLGATVNLASRVEGMTKQLGVDVLLTGATAQRLSRPVSSLGEHVVRGLKRPVTLFGLPARS